MRSYIVDCCCALDANNTCGIELVSRITYGPSPSRFELPHLMRNTDSNVLQPSKTDLVDVEINCRQNMHLWAQKPKQYSSIFFVFHVLAIAFITSYFCCRFPNWFVGYEILF